mgnify:CR=1 FL=1
MSKKKTGSFVLELDLKTIILLALISVGSGSIIFYLGMSYGKTVRNTEPGKTIIRSLEKPVAGEADGRDALFDPTNTGKTAETYEKEMLKILGVSASDKAKDKSTDAVALQKSSTSTKSKAADSDLTSDASKKDTNKAGEEKFYTIQVLATSVYDKANDLVTKLKEKSFEAYILSVPSDTGSIIYRVRVGRLKLPQANELNTRLTKELKGLSKPKLLLINQKGQ